MPRATLRSCKEGIETAGPNDQGLSRKHIIEGMKASLRRMELDYVDVLFCHRPDPHTPIRDCACHELRYRARMSLLLEHQRADFIQACKTADRLGLIRPIVEQAQYKFELNSTRERWSSIPTPSDSSTKYRMKS
ncbi:hypothetical protein PI124_g14395 [Phytophthora idaei]|nr:hypothetical protein PI125_g23689 [Phytophthora idaei]KAG3145169.1 hypothetical protein PI126_g13847 [Phytophthora idaei]KAG3240727.1 hypothetical protein PI124_g14395 [Phytophthora idaei]